MADNPRGAASTSARKMCEKGRLARCQEPVAKCQAAECERVGATLWRAVGGVTRVKNAPPPERSSPNAGADGWGQPPARLRDGLGGLGGRLAFSIGIGVLWLFAAGEKLFAVGQAGLEQSSLVSTNRARRRAGCLKRTWSAPNFSRGAGRDRQRLRISPWGAEYGIRSDASTGGSQSFRRPSCELMSGWGLLG